MAGTRKLDAIESDCWVLEGAIKCPDVTITSGTGSSPLDAAQSFARINGTEATALENLRINAIDTNEPNPKFKWQPSGPGSKVF